MLACRPVSVVLVLVLVLVLSSLDTVLAGRRLSGDFLRARQVPEDLVALVISQAASLPEQERQTVRQRLEPYLGQIPTVHPDDLAGTLLDASTPWALARLGDCDTVIGELRSLMTHSLDLKHVERVHYSLLIYAYALTLHPRMDAQILDYARACLNTLHRQCLPRVGGLQRTLEHWPLASPDQLARFPGVLQLLLNGKSAACSPRSDTPRPDRNPDRNPAHSPDHVAKTVKVDDKANRPPIYFMALLQRVYAQKAPISKPPKRNKSQKPPPMKRPEWSELYETIRGDFERLGSTVPLNSARFLDGTNIVAAECGSALWPLMDRQSTTIMQSTLESDVVAAFLKSALTGDSSSIIDYMDAGSFEASLLRHYQQAVLRIEQVHRGLRPLLHLDGARVLVRAFTHSVSSLFHQIVTLAIKVHKSADPAIIKRATTLLFALNALSVPEGAEEDNVTGLGKGAQSTIVLDITLPMYLVTEIGNLQHVIRIERFVATRIDLFLRDLFAQSPVPGQLPVNLPPLLASHASSAEWREASADLIVLLRAFNPPHGSTSSNSSASSSNASPSSSFSPSPSSPSPSTRPPSSWEKSITVHFHWLTGNLTILQGAGILQTSTHDALELNPGIAAVTLSEHLEHLQILLMHAAQRAKVVSPTCVKQLGILLHGLLSSIMDDPSYRAVLKGDILLGLSRTFPLLIGLTL